ncbi:chemoreceptor glutamine deamidase CheD (plasmid) [Comamonadaceae bacterium OTU4NAUVB1]|nr:chemoreceptor glutamine deamidase CheD [Comamonadaceae bacterium OTU4NAUVB1]
MNRQLVQAPSTKVYFDTTFQSKAARILPGEYHVTRDDMVIVTVLGSCVAACLRDPDSGIGGMNHFLLPDTTSSRDAEGDSARYGSYAMEVLINQLIKLGAQRHRLQAKVFGGANVIAGMHQLNIGQRNADFVLDFLRTEKIPVMASDLEDTCPRKVAYFPRNGVVRMKRLVDAGSQQIVRHEQRYKAEFSQAPVAGEVELFG